MMEEMYVCDSIIWDFRGKKNPIMSAHYEQYKLLLKVKKKNKFKKA